MTSPALYRFGAYVLYPGLAATGGLLLSRATSGAGLAAAWVLLLAAMLLPAWLGAYCRRCSARPGPRLLRLTVLPAVIAAALASRSASSGAQLLALALLGLSAVAFITAWRLAKPGGGLEAERRMAGKG